MFNWFKIKAAGWKCEKILKVSTDDNLSKEEKLFLKKHRFGTPD